MKSRAIVYFLFNFDKLYWNFNIQSAQSVKKHMPDIKIHLIAPNNDHLKKKIEPWIDEFTFVEKMTQEKAVPWAKRFEEFIKLNYDQIMALDSDTYMVEPCYELFDMLDHFDFVSTLEHHYVTGSSKIPVSFPQLNLGMFLWNKTEELDIVFQQTIDMIRRKRRGSDQPYFRIALYHSKIRYAVVPWEYNCHYKYPGYLLTTAKIIHSDSSILGLPADEKILNKRVYPEYPPYKRIFDGERLYLLKKRIARRTSPLEVAEVITYRKT